MKKVDSFRLADWTIYPGSDELERGGVKRKLESRVMKLLIYLNQHRGVVVGREELINEVWGKEALSDHSISVAVAALRGALGDDASNPRYVETVRKKGYRLIAEGDASHIVAPALEKKLPLGRRELQALFILIAGALGVVWLTVHPFGKSQSVSSRPTILVQDFNNATNDKTLDEFTIVLSDLFLAELARDNRARIQRVLPSAIAGDHQIVHGSTGEVISVAGHLITEDDQLRLSLLVNEPASSEIVWSENFRVYQSKHLVSARLASSRLLSVLLPNGSVPVEQTSVNPASRLASLYQLALNLEAIRSDATTRTAHALLTEALGIDPEYGPAHSLLAYLYAESGPQYWDMDGERYEHAENELKLARIYGSNEAHNLVTEAFLRRARDGRPDLSKKLLTQALELSPDDPWVLRSTMLTDVVTGDFENALANNIKAVERSLDPASILAERIFPLYFLGRFEEAADLYEAIRKLDLYPVYYGPQAATLAGDATKGFQLWVDLIRGHDVFLENEDWAVQKIAAGDDRSAYDWLQGQISETEPNFSRINVPILRASWHIAAGDGETAMETMVEAAREIYGDPHDKQVPSVLWRMVQYDPLYTEYRDDLRMVEILDLIGVNQISMAEESMGASFSGVRALASPK